MLLEKKKKETLQMVSTDWPTDLRRKQLLSGQGLYELPGGMCECGGGEADMSL